MNVTAAKANGIHYTPPELADFLARVTVEHFTDRRGPLTVLDPACGDGVLLGAFARALPERSRRRLTLIGYETDPLAIARAEELLGGLSVQRVELRSEDFLDAVSVEPQLDLLGERERSELLTVDAVIANPPYVRTQVLGSARAQNLAKRFNLSGRVDLYHAFTQAMAGMLKPGGVLGLLTSNRFLTIKSGFALRRLLSTRFSLHSIHDLGDSKLFAAAVLPVVVVAQKGAPTGESRCTFVRTYAHRGDAAPIAPMQSTSVLNAVQDQQGKAGLLQTPAGLFRIERGSLTRSGPDEVWALSTPDSARWLELVNKLRGPAFDDVARIRVGIKTTADEVFIRDRWDDLPLDQQPEPELLRPLIRHFDAQPWIWSGQHQQTVLYPHQADAAERRAINIDKFPGARRYLEANRERLEGRRYVVDGGRRWYEIWVPHHPDDWSQPKVVFPDIAEEPKFFLDMTGAVVNGDCYWMTLRPGKNPDWLQLVLAVANSSFITRYYDVVFHNKLYAGRRRFMTQYVKQFPLPDAASKPARKIVRLVKRLLKSSATDRPLQQQIDALVWESFGLSEEVARKVDL